MEKGTAAPATREFRIPVELLKAFQKDVRFIPNPGPHYGYITFDREMLKSILVHGSPEARAALAEHLDALYQAGGDLVIMAQTAAPVTQFSK